MKKVLFSLFFCACGNFFIFFSAAKATENQPFLTEIHPSEEYIEIYNPTEQEFSLEHWQWSEETSSGNEKLYDVENGVIEANGYFTISFSRKINDSGDTVRLYNTNGEIVETVEIGNKEDDMSWQKNGENWEWNTPSKDEENNFEEEIDEEIVEEEDDNEIVSTNYESISISEIFPNPEGTDSDSEFIELYNSSEETVSLHGLYLKDESGKEYFFLENDKILGNEYKSFDYSTTKISINNSGEGIFLFNENTQEISALSFSESAEEGYSFTQKGWTQTVTKNTENIISLPISSSSSGGNSGLFSEQYIQKNVNTVPEITAFIWKISANSSQDFIEIFCEKCNVNLENFRLGIDGEIFRIPKDTFVKNGETLKFIFQKNSEKTVEKTENGWIFYIAQSGLTTTDETVYFENGLGKIVDAVIWTNKNRYFTSSEKEEMATLIYKKSWKGRAQEFNAVNTKIYPRDFVLQRKKDKNGNFVDTNTKNDFFLSDKEEFFTLPENALKFSKFIFSEENTNIFIKNISTKKVFLPSVLLANKNSFIDTLSQEEKWIYPGETVEIVLPRKKIKRNDVVLGIYTQENEAMDIFCINSQKNAEKFLIFFKNTYKWKGKCISLPNFNNSTEKTVFFRKNFEKITWKNSYEMQNFGFSQKQIKKTENSEENIEKIQKKRIVTKEKNFFPSAFQEIELQKIAIVKVVPNPKGKDSENEFLVLKNTEGRSGWFRGGSIESGNKTKKIPNFFFEKNEKIVLNASFLPTLKNSNGDVKIFTKSGKKIDEIYWKKARENEEFGENAKKYVLQSNKIKKTPKKEKIPLFDQKILKNFSAILVEKNEKELIFEHSNTKEKFSYFYQKKKEIFFAQASVGSIFLFENSIKKGVLLHSAVEFIPYKIFQEKSEQIDKNFFQNFREFFFLLFFIGSAGVFYFLRRML